jgi:hypothetical protein
MHCSGSHETNDARIDSESVTARCRAISPESGCHSRCGGCDSAVGGVYAGQLVQLRNTVMMTLATVLRSLAALRAKASISFLFVAAFLSHNENS